MGTIETYLLLSGSSFAAGALNSVAGGGTLLTFPVLTAVVEPALANATSTVALLPGSVAGTVGYRRELWASRHWAARMVLPSLIGGGIGAWLVVVAPRVFARMVPWLILVAALLFLIQKPIIRWLQSRKNNVARQINNTRSPAKGFKHIVLGLFQLMIAIYGGYFGAGIGILMLSVLSYSSLNNIHYMNAIKTFLASIINMTSIVVFIWNELVVWQYAAPMACSAILGGYIGAIVARKLSPELVRVIIIIIAFLLSIYYFII